MPVNYDNIAKTFSASRKNMKWEEIEYFLALTPALSFGGEEVLILDIGCGNGRLLGELKGRGIRQRQYIGIDLSSGLLEEARKIHPGFRFEQVNMLGLNIFSSSLGREVPVGRWGAIFFIASFHHLENIDDRLSVLTQAYNILEPGGMIFMTHWALDSEINRKKYSKYIIPDSQNIYASQDYSIKFGEYPRYYHGFSTKELDYLFTQAGFEIIENREFENQKNIVSILKKPLHSGSGW